ncbi:hypothetical protein BC781_10337 [Sediminitomix flava]|uniref:Uncharacterized protein n=1 Tax=Sediminitomix flava TaxID=379075 RepID=A0A315ZWT4_SEDFL|nr:hypothetical protein BC781_10337 [Sediminitomix flava]
MLISFTQTQLKRMKGIIHILSKLKQLIFGWFLLGIFCFISLYYDSPYYREVLTANGIFLMLLFMKSIKDIDHKSSHKI